MTAQEKIDQITNEVENLKKDLGWQLSFQELDWKFFLQTANLAYKLQIKKEKLLELLHWSNTNER